MFTRFDTIHEHDRQTDRQTDGRTPHDGHRPSYAQQGGRSRYIQLISRFISEKIQDRAIVNVETSTGI